MRGRVNLLSLERGASVTADSRRNRPCTAGHEAMALLLAFLPILGCRSETTPAVTSRPVVAAVATATVARAAITTTIETVGTAEFDPEHLVATNLVRAGQVIDVATVAGQAVRKGDVLLSVGPVPAGSLDAQKARIDVDFAERELVRTRRLLGEKLATNQDLQNAEKQLASNQAVLAALGAADGGTPTVVRAPSDGIVAQVFVRPGALVQAGQEAVTLAVHRAMLVRAGFEVEDVPRLTEGAPIELLPVYAASGTPPVSARLSRLHAIADPTTQLVEAIIQLAEPPTWLVAGMRLHVHAQVAGARDALYLPRDAIVERDGRPGVFVVDHEEARWRQVSLGISDSHRIQVLSGLADGDVVVTTGRTSLADGMRVRIRAGDERGGT